ncbi:MAG: glycosyltransferase family 39 protein [Actinomycetia bacterium]|nr:glycosyltransferase family 39 protein [Actinomycetes bacterium]
MKISGIKHLRNLPGLDWTKKPAGRRKLALLVILFASLILFNYTNFKGQNWVIHPDDYEAYVIGKQLKETGNLAREEPLNEMFDNPVFTPMGAIYSEGRVLPTRAYGIYIISALGLFLGEQGPFYLMPIFGLLCVLFSYKLAKLMIGEKGALLTAFLFGFSGPFVYWNNMLYPNVPGVTFLVIGLYFIVKIAYGTNTGLRYYILAAVFFSFAVWIRYEQVLFIVLLTPIVFRYRYAFKAKHLLVGLATLALLLSPILVMNNALYANPFGTGYTKHMQSGENVESEPGNSEAGAKSNLRNIFDRFFGQNIHPDIYRVTRNAKNYIFDLFPMLAIAGVFGMFLMLLSRQRSRVIFFCLFLIAAIWTYDTCGGYHWGEGSVFLGATYVRYMLIVYLVLAICAPVLIERVRSVINPNAYRTLLAFFIISFLLLQAIMLMGSGGLRETREMKADFKHIDDVAGELPENAVNVASLYSKVIVDRKILNTDLVKSGEDIDTDKLIHYIQSLLQEGREVYLFESAWHKSSYLDIAGLIIKGEEGMAVEKMEDSYHGGYTDDRYRVYLTQ